MSNSLWPHGLQHTRLPCPSLTPGICSNSHPLGQWCLLILCCHLLLLPSIFPSIRVFSLELARHIRWPECLLELELQHQSFQWIFRVDFLLDWLLWFPCCPRDSPESSYFLDPVNSRVLWRVSSVSWINLPLFIYSLITLALLHPWG